MDAVHGATLHAETLELARGSNYATFATPMPGKYFGGDYPQPEGRVILVITAARQLLATPPAGLA